MTTQKLNSLIKKAKREESRLGDAGASMSLHVEIDTLNRDEKIVLNRNLAAEGIRLSFLYGLTDSEGKAL